MVISRDEFKREWARQNNRVDSVQSLAQSMLWIVVIFWLTVIGLAVWGLSLIARAIS